MAYEPVLGFGAACGGEREAALFLLGREGLGKGALALHGAREEEDFGKQQSYYVKKHLNPPGFDKFTNL